MEQARGRTLAGCPLYILGITEPEERTYRYLITHPGSTALEVADGLDMGERSTQRLLDVLSTKGLARHAPEHPRRYVPNAPGDVMEALFVERQLELERARVAIEELKEEAAIPREREHLGELITVGEAEGQEFKQMHRSAQREIIMLVRCPILISNLSDPRDYDSQREAQARGVRYRNIVDSEYLTLPGAIKATRADLESGQEVRVVPTLPFKMTVVDRRLALIYLNPGQPGCRFMLVRSSALLDALCTLFELLWERASPILHVDAGAVQAGSSGYVLSNESRELIPLLAAGLNDKAIAHDLGISTRTLERRVLELMTHLNVRTRFQAGWAAAARLAHRTVDA